MRGWVQLRRVSVGVRRVEERQGACAAIARRRQHGKRWPGKWGASSGRGAGQAAAACMGSLRAGLGGRSPAAATGAALLRPERGEGERRGPLGQVGRLGNWACTPAAGE